MQPLLENIQKEKRGNKLSKLQKEIFPYESFPLNQKEGILVNNLSLVYNDASLLGRKITRSVYKNFENAELKAKNEESKQIILVEKQESLLEKKDAEEPSKESIEKGIKDSDKPQGLLDPEENNNQLNQELNNPNIVFEYKLKEIMPNKDYGPKRIRLGLCCLNNYLRSLKNTVTCSRTLTLATYLEKGKKLAMERY